MERWVLTAELACAGLGRLLRVLADAADWPDDADGWASLLESTLTSVAIVLGGFCTYFHCVRGRTFAERLDLTASGSLTGSPGARQLLITIEAKNIGLSKVTVKHEGTTLWLYRALAPDKGLTVAAERAWEQLAAVPFFEE